MSKKKQRQAKARDVASIPAKPVSAGKIDRWLILICAGLALTLYANTLNHEFTVDDDTAIAKNKFTREGISALPKIFATPYRAGFYEREEGLYRPLSIALFAVIWEVVPEEPFAFHVINVLLYVLTGAVLFLLLRKMLAGKNLILPFLVTVLFVAHPVHTEVVANVKSADELLSFLFSALSLFFLLNYARGGKLLQLVISGSCYLLAVLAKESAIVLILVAPLTIYYFANPDKRKWIFSSSFFLAVFLVYITIRYSVLKGITGFNDVELINNSVTGAGDDVLKRVATAFLLLGKYMLLLFIPHPLCYDYSYNTIPVVSFADPKVLASLAVIIFLAVVAIRGFFRKNPISYGILFFAISIALVSNLFILIEATFAERFLYLPSLGFCIAIVFAAAKFSRDAEPGKSYSGIGDMLKKNSFLSILFGTVILLFSIKTISRNMDWKNNISLLETDVKTHPNSARIRYSLGSNYIFIAAEKEKEQRRKQQILRKGLEELKIGTTILPYYGDAWMNMGYAYNELEDYKNAVPCYEKGFQHVIKADQHHYIGAGIAYGETENYQRAFEVFRQVLAFNDTSFDAYNNIGMFQSRMGNYTEATSNLQKALSIRPRDAKANYNMGNTMAYKGDFQSAIPWYEKAVAGDPEFYIAWVNMGNSYAALKEYGKALLMYEEALKISPNDEQVRYNTGITYLLLGDSVKARQYLPSN